MNLELGAAARPRLARKAVLRRDPVRKTDLLLLPERVLKLNQTGGAIIRRCDGAHTLAEIAAELELEFNRSGLTGEVRTFLARLAKQGALET